MSRRELCRVFQMSLRRTLGEALKSLWMLRGWYMSQSVGLLARHPGGVTFLKSNRRCRALQGTLVLQLWAGQLRPVGKVRLAYRHPYVRGLGQLWRHVQTSNILFRYPLAH